MDISLLKMHPIYENNKVLFNNFIQNTANAYSGIKLLNTFLTFIDEKTISKKRSTRLNYNIRVTFFCLLDLFILCGFSKKNIKLPNNIIRLLNSINYGHKAYTDCTIIIPDKNIFSCNCGGVRRIFNRCKLDYCPYESGIIWKSTSNYVIGPYYGRFCLMAYKSNYDKLRYYENYIINKILCIDYDEIIFIGQSIGKALICKWEKNTYNTININKYHKICDVFCTTELANLVFEYYY